VLPWLGRSPRRPVQPFASPRKPSTDASVSRCRPHDRLFVGRRPQRPAAADRSVRAPRVASFPAPRRLLSTCSAPPLPLPRAEAPSADESLHAGLSQRLAFASFPRVPCPGVNQCLRTRAFGSIALLSYYVRSETGGRHRCARVAKTRARRPACFHGLAHACLLDPPCLAGCSPEPASHMPPIDFCNRVTPRAHACEPPNPTSRCLRSDHPPAARPLTGRSRPISADPRGRPATHRRIDSRTATARRTDLPQLDLESDTLMSRRRHRR
jgi:hypothetical protein